jgi:DNA-binding NtrC family response regulator
MKRRILLVDDEVAVLLTLKAVLEISGFEVETAASAKEAKSKLKKSQFAMIITDMRMENDAAGAEVIQAARSAEYRPALALLTAFPMADEDWQEMDTDKVEVLMKPMQTKVLLQQIEALLASHEARLASTKLDGADGHKADGHRPAVKQAKTAAGAQKKAAKGSSAKAGAPKAAAKR